MWVWWGAALLLGATLGVSSILGFQALQPAIDARLDPPRVREMPTSYYDLLAMSPDELAKVDIALMNLLCAKGLPGADNLDIPAVLKQIDEWAAKVKFETERHLYRVKDPRYAEHYANSEARLRAEFIVQVLQEDCGVRYNPERVYAPDFRDSRDMFIHGMLPGASGGTCASMPVMYVAIGRRLGYPMKLVQAKAHLFCRWGDGQERFNIEGASNGNVNYDPDEYYHTWPKPLSKADLASGVFLSSMTATQELAVFLDIRGVCCRANHRLPDARAAYAEAHRLEPRSQNTFAGLLAVCGAGPTLRHSDANPAADAWLREMMPPDPPPGMVPGPHPAPPPENPRGGG
ncbi:MAG: hypothetical protein KKB50_02965 [Planctomycetes bacterium]|nr:hypothetical protein [Planctomycetota bacterium]